MGSKSSAVTARPVDKARFDGINGVFQTAAFGCVLKGWTADAGAIQMHGPKISAELAQLAAQHEGVGKVIDYICAAGPYTGIITAALPLTVQLMVNHKMIDHTKVALEGIMAPDLLEKKVKNDLMAAEKEMRLALAEQEAAHHGPED